MEKQDSAGPSRFATAAAWIITLLVLAVVVFAAVRLGGALTQGLDEQLERRAADAAVVEAEIAAGSQYMDNVKLSAKIKPALSPDTNPTVEFTITNSGAKEVIRAAATLTFATTDAGEPAVENMIVLDASPLSVMTGKPLYGGEVRKIVKSLDAKPSWNLNDFTVELNEIRVSLPD